MEKSRYKENINHGTFDFPTEYYHVDKNHPRYEMMYHWHPEFEIIRIVSGDMLLNLDGEEFYAKEGDIIIVTDRVCHSGKPENCVYDCLVFNMHKFLLNSSFSSKVERILNHKRIINKVMPRENKEIVDVCTTIFDAMEKGETGYEFIVRGALYQLIGLILKYHLYSSQKSNTARDSAQQTSFKNAISFIEQNYSSKIRLNDIAKSAGMTPKYFCSFFFGITGKTPIEYVNFYRIERACEQLIFTDYQITEIAYNCGFNDVSYFTKTFKKITGNTPYSYRKKNS